MPSGQEIRDMLTAIDQCRDTATGTPGTAPVRIVVDQVLLDQLSALLADCLNAVTTKTPGPRIPTDDLLTRRQREILTWVAAGKSNSVIADILGISHHTVDTHLRRAFERLGTTDRTVAAIRSVQAGYIAPDGLLAA